MQVFNFSLTGTVEKVAAELVEKATDAPETEIRRALSDFITRQANDPGDTVSVVASITVSGSGI